MKPNRQIYLIEDPQLAEENEMRGDGKSYYCDHNGCLFAADLATPCRKTADDLVANGGQILCAAKDPDHLFFLGMSIYEGGQVESVERIIQQLDARQSNAATRKAVLETREKLAPPLRGGTGEPFGKNGLSPQPN